MKKENLDTTLHEELIRDSLKQIAANENIPEESIRDNIALAVSLAIKSDDPKAREFLEQIPCAGDSPTIDEVIDYITIHMAQQSNDLQNK